MEEMEEMRMEEMEMEEMEDDDDGDDDDGDDDGLIINVISSRLLGHIVL